MSSPPCATGTHVERRAFLALLAAGLVGALGSFPSSRRAILAAQGSTDPNNGSTDRSPSAATPGRSTSPAGIPDPRPGAPTVVSEGPRTNAIALTIDDGYCEECVAAYVTFVERTGIHLTFSPNGRFGPIWERHAPTLVPLIEAQQVQIANHSWSHRNMVQLGDRAIEDDIERNEDWIQRTFGITARPWFRPPYGAHNRRTDEVAGALGYTQILLWNGSFGDSTLLTPQQLLGLARRDLRPGTILLGHANHPTVTHLFDEIMAIIEDRGLQPVTLDAMFGTSRATG
jgi:peptidoglycan/xylan/chitin deacetylase (PgdA/CDA1 family)